MCLNWTVEVPPSESVTAALRLLEGPLEGLGDLGGERGRRAPGLALDEHVVGHDVGRVAGGSGILAAEDADIAGPVAAWLHDLAEPAFAVGIRDRDGADERGRYALLRRDARVGRLAGDLDFPVLLPHRADEQLGGQLAVDVEAHRDVAEVRRVRVHVRRAGRSLRAR